MVRRKSATGVIRFNCAAFFSSFFFLWLLERLLRVRNNTAGSVSGTSVSHNLLIPRRVAVSLKSEAAEYRYRKATAAESLFRLIQADKERRTRRTGEKKRGGKRRKKEREKTKARRRKIEEGGKRKNVHRLKPRKESLASPLNPYKRLPFFHSYNAENTTSLLSVLKQRLSYFLFAHLCPD